jgi:hypothetical protein
MAALSRSVATLRLAGDDLIPDELSRLLGVQPTYGQRKGEVVVLKSGATTTAKFGQWRLEATAKEPEDVNEQIAQLLCQLTQDLEVWHQLARRFRVDLFCGWFMNESNEGVSICAASLRALGERGIELDVDLYAPDTDA